MAFDVQGALRAGYSAEDIAGFLAQRAGLDLQRATAAGYAPEEIIERLAGGEAVDAEPVPPPPPPAPRVRGGALQEAGRSLALGVRTAGHALGALPGAIYDVASLPVRGVAALTGMQQPMSSQQLIDRGADALGLPEPENARERITQRVGTELGATLVGMGAGQGLRAAATAAGPAVTPGMRGARAVGDALASYPASQISGAVGAGVAGGAMSEAAPDSPMADLGAAVVGGVAGGAAVPIAQGAARGMSSAARMFTQAGAEDAAAAALLRASDDPTTLAARLRREGGGLDASQRTAGEAAGDAGLLQVERAARNMPEIMPGLATRDRERDAVRRGAIEGLEERLPGEGLGSEEVARGVGVVREREAARVEAARQAEVARLEAERARVGERWTDAERALGRRVDRAARDLPRGETPEAAGAVIREEADLRHDAAWERTRRAFAEVDPEGQSRIPVQPILAAADEVIARLFRPLGSPPPERLVKAVEDLRGWIDVRQSDPTAPFQNLQAFRSRLVDLANEFGSGGRGSNSRGLAAVTEIKKAVDDQARRAAEPWERPTGPRGPDDIDAQEAMEAAAQHPDVAAALVESAMGGMSRGLTQPASSPSLVQFMRAMGGLRNNRGEMAYMMGSSRALPGLWNDRSGMSLHRAMETAIAEGYFPGHDIGSLTEREFLEAISEGLRGRHRYPEGFDPGRMAAEHAMAAREDLIQEVSRRGGTMVPGDPDATLQTMRQANDDPERIGWDPGAPPPGAPGYVVDPVAQGTAFTPEQAQRYRAAIDARQEQGANFERGAMGRVVNRGEGGSRTADSVVAQQFFHGGDGAASDVQQFIAALGDRGRAMRALEGYAAQSLRDYALSPEGKIVASRARAWLGRHRAALRQMPEVEAKFATVEQAARTAEAGMARGATELAAADRALKQGTAEAERAAKRSQGDFERGAVRYWLRGTEPEVAIARALGAGNADQNMRELKRMMHGDAPALRGLRRAYAEEWLRTISNTAAQHADGAPRLRADQSRRFLARTERAAAVLFTPAEREQIGRIAEDFRSGSMVNSVGRAVGSNTAQNLASARNLSTAYVLARATSGLLHGEPGSLPATILRPLQFLMRLPEEQVRRALGDLILDPDKAARLTAKVSAENLQMVARYAQRSTGMRLGEAAGAAGVRGTQRAVVSAEAGEAQREARRPRGYAAGGVVDDSAVRLRRHMAPIRGRGPGEGQGLAQHMLPVEGDGERIPRAVFREGYTPEEREAVADNAPIVPAGIGQRAPRLQGGRDYEGQMTPEGAEAVREVASLMFPDSPAEVALTIAAPGLGGPLARGFVRGLERVGLGSAGRRAAVAAGVGGIESDDAEAGLLRRGMSALMRSADEGRGGGSDGLAAARRARQERQRLTAEEQAALPEMEAAPPLVVPGDDIRERRRAAEQWVRQNLQGRMLPSEALGAPDVRVTRHFAGKMGHHAGDAIIGGLPSVPEVVRRGGIMNPAAAPDAPVPADDAYVDRFHYLGARLGPDGLPYRAVVRELRDGQRLLHDFGRLSDPEATAGATSHQGASRVPLLEGSPPGPRRGLGSAGDDFKLDPDEADESWTGYARGGLAGGLPGPADEIATAQGAAMRGVAQAQQMWSAAGSLIGGGGQAMAHSGLVG